MRIRQLKPDYWRDSRLHNTPGITADVREFYIGLWGVADDEGFLRWDLPEVASELYRYQSPARRERNVGAWVERLVAIGRVEFLPCGVHAYIPKLTTHQRIGGKRSQTYVTEHLSCGKSTRVREDMDLPQLSARNGKGNGRERNGTESNGKTDYEDALARAAAKAGRAA